MNDPSRSLSDQLKSLQERAKELSCLYAVDGVLHDRRATTREICNRLIEVIPSGWQYPDICAVRIVLEDQTLLSSDFREEYYTTRAVVQIDGETAGVIEVCYTKEMPSADRGPFLREEVKLLETIAARLGQFVSQQRAAQLLTRDRTASQDGLLGAKHEWQVDLDLLRRTDKTLYMLLSRKMLNHLCWMGTSEAEALRHLGVSKKAARQSSLMTLQHVHPFDYSMELSDRILEIAASNLSEVEILSLVRKWLQESKLYPLVRVLDDNRPNNDVDEALRHYHRSGPSGEEAHSAISRGVLVSLIRQFLSSQFEYINIAKDYLEIVDFHELLQNVVHSEEGHGKLGGKAASSYLAWHVIKKSIDDVNTLHHLKLPKTWYITSDMALRVMHYNSFYEIIEQKYKEITLIRSEYPSVVQAFKDAYFPPELLNGLSIVLDDLVDTPLIIRSSSLLEERLGVAFSGKYKSVFVANQGSKQERLAALTDAIAEVYASTFHPDPLEYRAKLGLLDFNEEMGIMIQEVVGTRIGDFYLPIFSGITKSGSDVDWPADPASGISMIHVVPGLKTSVLSTPDNGQAATTGPNYPDSGINIEVPKEIDVINLETNRGEAIELDQLLRDHGSEIYNLIQSGMPAGQEGDFSRWNHDPPINEQAVRALLNEWISRISLEEQLRIAVRSLQDTLGTRVTIQFAFDGRDLYLLHCRFQTS